MHDEPDGPAPQRRGLSFWVDVTGTALVSLLLACVIIFPIQAAGARLTESSRTASIVFGIFSSGFGIALAIVIFRFLRR